MFGKKENLIGIDIGSYSVKMIELKGKKSGYLLKSISEVVLPEDVISEGSIVDYAEVTRCIREAFQKGNFSHKKVASALKGTNVIAKKVTLAIEDEKNFSETFRWEAEQYIGRKDLEDYNIDYEVIGNIKQGEHVDVVIAVARKDLIMDLSSVIESAGLKPMAVDLSVFTLINAFEVNYGIEEDVIAIVDIGNSSTQIVFVKNGVYEFSREVNYSGKNCVEMIQQRLGITREDAVAKLFDIEAVEYDEELRSIINDFNIQLATEVKNSINMFLTSGQIKTNRCYICGGGSVIYGLKEVFEQRLDISVNQFNPFANIEIDKSVDMEFLNNNLYKFNCALGLALRKVDDK
ncbi:MAG: type pilus assembly protein PilM [Deferribacteres bacterium]|jgi:type IV pilus assembly protein PilM|nr:type pilus assembly protein PilM [Deferribacteres bacterium]